jgi:signal transduction histidine kinase
MRWRLIAVLVGFTAIVILIMLIPVAALLRDVTVNKIITGQERDAFTLAGASVEVLEDEFTSAAARKAAELALGETVDGYAANHPTSRVVIVDAESIAVADSQGDPGDTFIREEITMALQGKAVSDTRESNTLGQPIVYVAVPVRSGVRVLGAVRITQTASDLDREVNTYLGVLVVGAVSTLVGAAIIAVLLATTVTRRVRRLRDAAETIAEGDMSARADVGGGGEIQELAESFNTMADRVQAVVESQRGFAGDASHQLRTPLTALRLRLDRAADLMDLDDPAVDQVDAARDEIDRLQRLIDGLLVLARADGRDHETMPVDIRSIAEDRVDSWRAFAAERGVTIDLDAPSVAVAHAVESAPEQIIDNYIDNALEVVPDGGRILVSVRTEPGGVVITVDDNGPGLPAEHREHAFDRFWRGTQEGTGSGLGLAVVASLAHASGGAVWLAASPLGGVRAAARFLR